MSYQGSTVLFCLQNKLPSWQLKEDGEYASSRTFDFHKFAENFKAQSSVERWSSDSNGLKQDFTPAKSTGQPSLGCDSDSENDEDDEIFLVFRGKPNSRLSSFDECQAAAGKVTTHSKSSIKTCSGLFISSMLKGGGGVLERQSLFNLAKVMVSFLRKI